LVSGAERTRVSCVGPEVIAPDWRASAQVGCRNEGSVDNEIGTRFAFSKDFAPSEYWRAAIGVSGINVREWWINGSLTLSLGRNLEYLTDVNLRAAPGFHLESERDRPVYAPPDAIDPVTGLFPATASRRDARFGQIMIANTGLQSRAWQARLTVVAPPLGDAFQFVIDYLLSVGTEELTGLGAPTFGDPRVQFWARSGMPRHQFHVTTLTRIGPARLGLRADLLSGIPFTPLVDGDINGDGRPNDLAFLPASEHGSENARALNDFIRAAPPRVARCLASHRGEIAPARSCHGEWKLRVEASLDLAIPVRLPVGDLVLSARSIGLGSALARVLGINAGVVREDLFPDGRLWLVRGFDRDARAFSYELNQGFGRAVQAGSGVAGYPVFGLQVGGEIRLGGPPTNPILRRLELLDGGDLRPRSGVRDALWRQVGNPIDSVLRWSNDIALTQHQQDTLHALRVEFIGAIDSTLAAVLDLAHAGSSPPTDVLLGRPALLALNAAHSVALEFQARALAVLGEDQQSLLRASRVRQRN
jgi:hypothetical protein